MLLENQWFWLIIMGFFVIMYLIIGKICETIENIQISKQSHIDCNTMKFHNIQELDRFINELQKIRNTIEETEKEDDR